jgi:TonB dependent receptor
MSRLPRLIRLLPFFLSAAMLHAQARPKLVIAVNDENGVAVPSALVFVQLTPKAAPLRCETDFSGTCEFNGVAAASGQIRVEKTGFYSLLLAEVQLASRVDLTITHVQEIKEVVNVNESPLTVDPAQVAKQEQLTGLDIVNIPYPSTRDYRNVLNFIPGVVQDTTGQPHLDGAETYQTLTLLDGFNITQPVNGLLLARVSTDALRSVNVQTSRLSPQYGKGSAGLLDLTTGIGDDHYRFAMTNFIPSFQNRKGFSLDKFDPRFTLSGPIREGKMWFFDAADGEYDNVIFTDLPDGADRDAVWRAGNLAKVQTNVTSRDILTGSFLINHFHDEHSGLSLFNPVEATPIQAESAYITNFKESHYFSGGELLEVGFGFVHYGVNTTPLGSQPYFITPEQAGGNYYFTSQTRARRWQGIGNFYMPPLQWHGQHELKFGVDVDRLGYDADFERTPISYLREGQSLPPNATCLTLNPSPCSRYSLFPGVDKTVQHNAETSAYAQDRWQMTNRLLVEGGLRFDWDEILRQALFAPRLAGTYVLDESGTTKLSAGVGIIYDATPIFLIARPDAGQRVDYFFNPDGTLTSPAVNTNFAVNTDTLRASRSLNTSVSLEKKFPWAIYANASVLYRRGAHGFVYNTLGGATSGTFFLQNTREDRYHAFQINLRRSFRDRYGVMVSYTRSRSTSNQVLDFNVDSPIFTSQAAGPYPWDAPNRLITWGFLPFFNLPWIGPLDAGYSAEARTGFPYNVVNDQFQLVGAPGSRRYPDYFSLNLHLEKRFHALGFFWALRGGYDNITGRKNPVAVNNNIESPQFGTFSGFDGRAFTARIRFLGRK